MPESGNRSLNLMRLLDSLMGTASGDRNHGLAD